VPNLLGLASLQNNFKVSVFVPANKKLEALIKKAEMTSIALSCLRELSSLYRLSIVYSQTNPDQTLVEDCQYCFSMSFGRSGC